METTMNVDRNRKYYSAVVFDGRVRVGHWTSSLFLAWLEGVTLALRSQGGVLYISDNTVCNLVIAGGGRVRRFVSC